MNREKMDISRKKKERESERDIESERERESTIDVKEIAQSFGELMEDQGGDVKGGRREGDGEAAIGAAFRSEKVLEMEPGEKERESA